MRSSKDAFLILLSLVCCLAVPALAQTNRTNSTSTTPAPTGSGVVIVLYINGVFVNLTCNISLFGNITCASDYDHVVTVTRLDNSTDNTLLWAMVGLAIGLVVIVAGVAGAAYYNTTKNVQNYQPLPPGYPVSPYPVPNDFMPEQPQGFAPQDYGPPGYPQPTPYQPGPPYDPSQQWRGETASQKRKVINVDLVRPCLPEEPLAVMRMA